MENISTSPKTISLTSNQVKDFWLLGGLSILLWLLLLLLEPMKTNSEIISSRFLQLSILFSWLSFVCNYPHFLVSYKFAYGRGSKFILANWAPLIAVPLALIFLYILSYVYFHQSIPNDGIIKTLNEFLLKTGLLYQIGSQPNLGTEILAFTIRIMYITVGWHYAKQIFGCMMVYGNYSSYPFSTSQRKLIKWSLFCVASYNFFYMSIPQAETNLGPAYFFNISLNPLGFSLIFLTILKYAVLIMAGLVCYFVFYKNYKEIKKTVPVNVLVAYVAFFVWWIPPFRQNEFYFLTVPFFHSLQYLPFAYRLEVKRGAKTNNQSLFISIKIIALIIIGILAFETVPTFLDKEFNSYSHFNTWFFMISFAVFINIHHFFIDSVIWKFTHKDIRDRILN